MRKLARVEAVSTDLRTAEVRQLYSAACIDCPSLSSCTRLSPSSKVTNPDNFNIKTGDYVKLQLPALTKALCGAAAVLFPILLAFAACFLMPLVLRHLGINVSQLLIFICSFIALITGEILVFVFSITKTPNIIPEICQII